jgi:hypothetical protein
MEKVSFNKLSQAANDIKKLQQTPIYYSGNDTFVMNIENASLEDYISTCDQIKANSTSDDIYTHNIGDNLFIWVNKSEGYEGAYYIPSRNQVRMIKRLSGQMIPLSLTEEKSFGERKKLIQLCPDDNASNFGMGYIVCLGNGHFIIYDGNGDSGDMATKIYNHLVSNTPDGHKPIIDAWIVSHVHWDHVTAMLDFSNKYAEKTEVRNILANFPAHHNLYIKERGENTNFYSSWWPKILANFSSAKEWKIHTGQVIEIADVRIEVLLTHEDVYPATLYPNDSSTVTMMYLNGQKIFFSSDIEYEYPCKLLHDMYGSYLKSEYYQASHHGWNSEALYFYDDVDAKNILWPVRYRYWEMIQQFPATKRLTSDLESQKKKFYMTIDEDSIIEF